MNLNNKVDKIDLFLIELQKGNTSVMDEIYEYTKKQLFLLCYSYLKNEEDSKDALQDSYIKMWKQINRFKGRNGFNWLYTITKNTCLDYLKKSKKIVYIDFQDEQNVNLYEIDQNTNNVIEDENGIIELAKEVLNDKEFRVVMLHAISKIKLKDIARSQGMNEATIRWQYNNSIKKLRNEYERRNK